jgi:hypothetical protein
MYMSAKPRLIHTQTLQGWIPKGYVSIKSPLDRHNAMKACSNGLQSQQAKKSTNPHANLKIL